MTLYDRRMAIQNAIVSTLTGVSGVENVYTEYQTARTADEFLTKFRELTQDRLQTWVVRRVMTRPDTNETNPDVAIRCEIWWYHTFEIELFYGYREGLTEEEYQRLIDDVLDAFRTKRTLGGWQAEALFTMSEPVSAAYLKNAFAHYAKFTVTVIDIETGVTPT